MMNLPYWAHLTLVSMNTKTGPIPVSVTEERTCPDTCSFKGDGCFAENGHLALHWRHVSSATRGMPWSMFCDAISTLRTGQLWRHNAAGDLPGDGKQIDAAALAELVQANFGKRGFTYTHYRPEVPGNAEAIASANLAGFTINLSADSIDDVDKLAELGIGPVVCVLPSTATENLKTAAGRNVVICPATQRSDTSCATCELCHKQRDAVIGFPAHGSRHKRVDIRLAKPI